MAIFIRLYLSLSASEEFVIVKMNPRLAKKLRPAGTLVNWLIGQFGNCNKKKRRSCRRALPLCY